MVDPLSTSAIQSDYYSKLFKFTGVCAFEFHAIIVKSLPENRIFNTIKLFKISRDLLYLRPEGISLPENHNLLLRGPKVAIFGSDESSIVIGDKDWEWYAGFDDYKCRNEGIQSVLVKDPEFQEAAVEIIFEKISEPAQAHFRIIFYDYMNKDRQINIVRGEIAAISNGDLHTKRLLRCFGDDLIEHMLPSSQSKKFKPYKTKLVSGEAIDLYKSHTIIPARSELAIDLNIELEFVTGGSTMRSSVSFERTVSFTAPADPDWLENKDLIPYAMKVTKETCILEIDEFARIQVEVSWFNDRTSYVHENVDYTLWGYRDGDCDYKDIGVTWTDKQEKKRSG